MKQDKKLIYDWNEKQIYSELVVFGNGSIETEVHLMPNNLCFKILSINTGVSYSHEINVSSGSLALFECYIQIENVVYNSFKVDHDYVWSHLVSLLQSINKYDTIAMSMMNALAIFGEPKMAME